MGLRTSTSLSPADGTPSPLPAPQASAHRRSNCTRCTTYRWATHKHDRSAVYSTDVCFPLRFCWGKLSPAYLSPTPALYPVSKLIKSSDYLTSEGERPCRASTQMVKTLSSLSYPGELNGNYHYPTCGHCITHPSQDDKTRKESTRIEKEEIKPSLVTNGITAYVEKIF